VGARQHPSTDGTTANARQLRAAEPLPMPRRRLDSTYGQLVPGTALRVFVRHLAGAIPTRSSPSTACR
jgi:hypothetical protein